MILKKASKKWLLFIGAVALYAALLAWMRWCPPVSGVAVDAETGKPVEGAEIVRVGEGPYLISLEANVHYCTPEALGKSDAGGHFSLPPTVNGNLGVLSFIPFGWVSSVALNVYAKDYIPSDVHENVWGEYGNPRRYEPLWHGWEEARSERAVFRRRHRWFRGYEYRIELTRAKTEQDWIIKCGHTIDMHGSYVSKDMSDAWLFSDLTRYLEQWPAGEKAGEYYRRVEETAALGTCQYIREGLASGRLSRAELRLRYDRARKIISLAEGFQWSPQGMNNESFQEGLQFDRGIVSCAAELLGEEPPSLKRDKP